MDGCMDGCIDGWMDGWMDRWMVGWMDDTYVPSDLALHSLHGLE